MNGQADQARVLGRGARRGSAYVFVLTASMLVATAGIATLVIQRGEMASGASIRDAQLAEQRAMEVLQLGAMVLQKDPHGVLYRPLTNPPRSKLEVSIPGSDGWSDTLTIEAIAQGSGREPAPYSDVRVTAQVRVGEATRVYSYIARPVLKGSDWASWRSATTPPTGSSFGQEIPLLLRSGLIVGGAMTPARRPEDLRGGSSFMESFLAIAPRDLNPAETFYSQVPQVVMRSEETPVVRYDDCLPTELATNTAAMIRTWEQLSQVLYPGQGTTIDPQGQMGSSMFGAGAARAGVIMAGGSGQIKGSPGANAEENKRKNQGWRLPGLGERVLPARQLIESITSGRQDFGPIEMESGALVGANTSLWHIPILDASMTSFASPGINHVMGEIGPVTDSQMQASMDGMLYSNGQLRVMMLNARPLPTVVQLKAPRLTRLSFYRAQACTIIRGSAEIVGPVCMDPPVIDSGLVLPTLIVDGNLTITSGADGRDLAEEEATGVLPQLGKGLNQVVPYFDDTDNDVRGRFPARIRGVVYVTGDLTINAGAALTVEGVLLVGGNLTMEGNSTSSMGQLTLRYQPPMGPVLGCEEVTAVRLVGGSLQRAVE